MKETKTIECTFGILESRSQSRDKAGGNLCYNGSVTKGIFLIIIIVLFWIEESI